MKKYISHGFFALIFSGFSLLFAACVNDTPLNPGENDFSKGYLNVSFALESASRGSITVAGANEKENSVKTLDLFFYENKSDGTLLDSPAKFYKHFDNVSSSGQGNVFVSLNSLKELFPVGNCRIAAVANCSATKNLTNPTVNSLKKITVTENKFAAKGDDGPSSFVMSNLNSFGDDASAYASWDDESGSGEVRLKRLAAKIRVALDIDKENGITDVNGVKWLPDISDIRLFISNAVVKGQLDEDIIELTESDYYHIKTSGSTNDDSDYDKAHEVTEHVSQAPETPEVDLEGFLTHYQGNFPFYNDEPYYTYPNAWDNNMLQSTSKTSITIVVPWYRNEGGKRIYVPSYYIIPVNKGTKIESNKYYFNRVHINMMGSVTPEKPMEVDIQCQVLDWGTADDTFVDIRPVKYLVFNQAEFVMNNVADIVIPFSSTDRCEVKEFQGTYYTFKGAYGKEVPHTFYSSTNPRTYTITFNSAFNELYFHHDFLKINDYSRYEIEFTVLHSGEDVNSTVYKQKIKITVYPAIHISTEFVETESSGVGARGWLMVNGYATSDAGTGGLGRTGQASPSAGGDDTGSLTTLTVTQFNETQKLKWVIDDPRTYYINNNLAGAADLTDTQDVLGTWANNEPFDGTQTNNSRGGVCKTIWEYFPTAEPVYWSNYTKYWDPADDGSARSMEYYYPCAEDANKGNIIAPKIVASNYYAYSTPAQSRQDGRRRCATMQQAGYPAGRWRLPTGAELELLKDLQAAGIIKDIFAREKKNDTNGGVGTNWCNRGATGDGSHFGGSSSYVRCVYDLWYWEKVDANGVSTGRIPPGTNNANWKIFTWGDRPKENPQNSRAGRSYSIQDYLQENAPGNYAVIREGNNVKLEKLQSAE